MLGRDQPFYAVQQYELSKPAAAVSSIGAMAETYVDAVRAVRPAGPYVLAGMCSTGAYVAYEMAQQVRALGEDVELVVLFDPMYGEVALGCSHSHLLVGQARDITGRINCLPATDTRVPGLRAALADVLSEVGMEPSLLELGPRRLGQFLDLFAANHQATLTYSPRPYPGRAAIFVPAFSNSDERLRSEAEWKALVPAVEIHAVPATRAELYSAPEIVAYLAAAMQAALQ